MQSEGSYLRYLQSDEAQAIFRLSQAVTDSLRDYLQGRGFIEFLPPVVSSVTDPGLRGAERLPVSLYKSKAYVMSSMVFHKQVLASAFGRIYSFASNVRLEPVSNADSGRHLVEFCQLDLEEAGVSLGESMRLAEDMLKSTIGRMLERWQPLLQVLHRDLRIPTLPFKKIRYEEAVSMASSYGFKVRYGDELPQEVEAKISAEVGDFVWIIDYPKDCRGFYYKESPEGETVLSMDLLYPEGYGEAISGGEREFRSEKIRRRISEASLDASEFTEFIKMAESGLLPTGGFGIGIERLVRYIAGEREITRVRPFPKTPGRISM